NRLCATLLLGGNVPAHRGELTVGVDEVAKARTDQSGNGDISPPADFRNEASTGRRPSGKQLAAKLNPVSATAFCSDSVFHRLNADFHDDTVLHGLAQENRCSRYRLRT